MKKNILKITTILFLGTAIVSCEKEYDSPPIKTIEEGKILKIGTDANPGIGSLHQIYNDSVATGTGIVKYSYKFEDDYSVFATVAMGEETGNLYKEVYLQDDSLSPLKIALTASSNLIAGDRVRLALKGTILRFDNGVILDSVNPDNNIIKISTENFITPMSVSLADVNMTDHKDRLIKVTNCEFDRSAALGTFAHKGAGSATEYNLVDCAGNSLLVRTSDYCNFAADSVPDGQGSVVGILGTYGTTLQFYIRDPKEINMPTTSCFGNVLLSKDFEDASITSGGWNNYWTGDASQQGQAWSGQFIASFGAAVVKNYDSGAKINYATTSWLISPKINLIGETLPVLSFETAARYSGYAMELYVSGDYPGTGDPATTGTWLNISSLATWSQDATSAWLWTKSGDIDLTDYISANTYIAFKYTGSTSQGMTWELDNISIKAQ